MTHTEFCYWLQGHFELNGNKPLTAAQVAIVREHLELTFNKVTTEKLIASVATPLRPIPGQQWIRPDQKCDDGKMLLSNFGHLGSC